MLLKVSVEGYGEQYETLQELRKYKGKQVITSRDSIEDISFLLLQSIPLYR